MIIKTNKSEADIQHIEYGELPEEYSNDHYITAYELEDELCKICCVFDKIISRMTCKEAIAKLSKIRDEVGEYAYCMDINLCSAESCLR